MEERRYGNRYTEAVLVHGVVGTIFSYICKRNDAMAEYGDDGVISMTDARTRDERRETGFTPIVWYKQLSLEQPAEA